MNKILRVVIIAIVVGIVSAVVLNFSGLDQKLSPAVTGGIIGGVAGGLCVVFLRTKQ